MDAYVTAPDVAPAAVDPIAFGIAARGTRPGWLLPDDEIIDLIAVEIAVKGTRAVRLTARERCIAAGMILARHGSDSVIAARLSLTPRYARELAARLRAAATAPVLDGAA
jgi:hypothetical protein